MFFLTLRHLHGNIRMKDFISPISFFKTLMLIEFVDVTGFGPVIVVLHSKYLVLAYTLYWFVTLTRSAFFFKCSVYHLYQPPKKNIKEFSTLLDQLKQGPKKNTWNKRALIFFFCQECLYIWWFEKEYVSSKKSA